MPKNNNPENQEKIPLIERTEQTSSYYSINSTAPRKNHYSDKVSDPASHFFTQQFKKDFPLNDFSGSNTLNVFKF